MKATHKEIKSHIEIPTELYRVVALQMHYVAQNNGGLVSAEAQVRFVERTVDVLSDHAAMFVLDILRNTQVVATQAEVQAAATEVLSAVKLPLEVENGAREKAVV